MKPDLDALTRPEVLLAELQRGLPGFAGGALVIESLVISQARRSASRQRHPHPLTLVIELQVFEPGSGRRGPLRLFARVHRDGASAAALAAVDRKALAPVAFGLPLARLPRLDMLLWAWPNDPAMPQLPRLLQPDRLWDCLPADVRRDALGVLQVSALRHEPGERATLRCELSTRTGTRTVYGKTFADDRGATIHERFRHFHHAAQLDPDAPRVAEPLGWDSATGTLWQAAAGGLPLPVRPDAACLRRVGRALARVHAAPLPATLEHDLDHALQEAGRRAQKIGRALPGLAGRAAGVAAWLETEGQRLPPCAPTLIHGDFHPGQLAMQGDRVWLFDFDEFARGNPMEDLAAFIVRLRTAGVEPAAEQAFRLGWAEASGRPWHGPWLRWHLVQQNLLQASRAFVFQVADWPTQVERRLARAEGLFDAQPQELAA